MNKFIQEKSNYSSCFSLSKIGSNVCIDTTQKGIGDCKMMAKSVRGQRSFFSGVYTRVHKHLFDCLV